MITSIVTAQICPDAKPFFHEIHHTDGTKTDFVDFWVSSEFYDPCTKEIDFSRFFCRAYGEALENFRKFKARDFVRLSGQMIPDAGMIVSGITSMEEGPV